MSYRGALVRFLPTDPLARHLLKSTGWNFILQLATKIAMLVFSGCATRALSLAGVGQLLSIQGVMVFAAAGIDLGTSTLTVRDISKGANPGDAWRRVRGLRKLAFACVVITTLAVHYIFHLLSSLDVLLLILGGGAVAQQGLLQSILLGTQRYSSITRAITGGRLVLLLGSLSVLIVAPKIHSISVYLFILVASEVVSAVLLWGKARDVVPRGEKSAGSIISVALESLPHATNSAVNIIYNKADSVMVNFFAGPHVAGLYGPASLVQNAFGGFLSSLSVGIIPASRIEGSPAAKVARSRATAMRSAAIGFIIFACGALLFSATSKIWVPLAYGPKYAHGVLPFCILLASVPIAALSMPRQQLAVVQNRAGSLTGIYVAVLAITVTAHFLLDARFGAAGAAFASFSREPLVLVALVLLTRPRGGDGNGV